MFIDTGAPLMLFTVSAQALTAPISSLLPIFEVNLANNSIYNGESIELARQGVGRRSNQIYLYGVHAQLFVPSHTDTINVCQIPNVSVSFLLSFLYIALLVIHIQACPS